MSWENLPFEIVKCIFGHVDRKHYYDHLFVSKKWHSMVKPIYYAEVTIGNSELGWLLQQEEGFKAFQYFSMTKKLCILDDAHSNSVQKIFKTETDEHIKKLFLCFRNIVILDVHKSVYCAEILTTLGENFKKEDFPYLKEAYIGKQSDACLKFLSECPALKCLDVCGVTEDFGFNVLQLTSNLKSLNKLVINKSEPWSNVTLFSVLNNCGKNLSYIDVTTGGPMRDTSLLDKDLQQLIEDQKLDNVLPQTENFQHLQVLFLTTSSLSVPYIDFFRKHCPSNLKHLEIKCFDEGFFTWMNKMPLGLVIEFATSLSKIETLIFETGKKDHTTEATDERVDRFYHVLNAIVGDRDIASCTAQLTNYGDHNINISIRENSNLFYRYRINPFDYLTDESYNPDEDDEYDFRQNYYEIDFFIPTPSSSSYYSVRPQAINHLDFTIYWHFECFENPPTECLEYASQNCPHLNTFKMTYFDCNDPEFRAHALSARQDSESTKSCLEDMTIITLGEAGYVEFLSCTNGDIFQKYFPKMKTLELILEKSYYPNCFHEMHIRLERCRYLTSFRIDIDNFVEVCDINFVYCKFNYGDIERVERLEFGKEGAPAGFKSISADAYYRYKEKQPFKLNYTTINIKECSTNVKEFFLGSHSLLTLDSSIPELQFDDCILKKKMSLLIKFC